MDAEGNSIAFSSRPASSRLFSLGLPQRIALFVALFAIEWIPIPNLVQKGIGASAAFQVAIVFASLFLTLGYARAKNSLQDISRELESVPIAWGFLAGHFAALIGFVFFSFLPFGSNASSITTFFLLAVWLTGGALVIALAGFAFVPPKLVLRLARSTGNVWVYALVVGAIAWRLGGAFRLWNESLLSPVTALTFNLVKALLHPFLSHPIADRAAMTIGSPAFNVKIAPECSGIEGTALMLVFSIAWLFFFRREFRFPQAFLLVPAALLTMWVSNAVRIAALILIGVAGSRGVALGGFHSQAGWIVFNCVALGFILVAQRLPWFSARTAASSPAAVAANNPTAAYLMPFLAILAAAMVSGAASSGFEWLYPLRFVAAGAALWVFRSAYKDLDWRFGWFSPAIGGLVFALWLGLDRLSAAPAGSAIGAGLAAMPPLARIAWLALRTAGAVITVPIAEELAFRGFLIRRAISPDFESLGLRESTWVSVLISSVAFGLMHGDRWIAGAIAGLLYAAAMLKRGRIGDAVVAHATTNALLAAWVMYSGAWGLW